MEHGIPLLRCVKEGKKKSEEIFIHSFIPTFHEHLHACCYAGAPDEEVIQGTVLDLVVSVFK